MPLLNQSSGKLEESAPVLHLKYDINILLGYFNELDRKDTGFISFKQLKIFFRTIELQDYESYIVNENAIELEQQSKLNLRHKHKGKSSNKNSKSHLQNHLYQFDHILSIIGHIQVPEEPSIYVISFVKILAQYRDSCIKSQQSSQTSTNQDALLQAKQIQAKIQKIIKRELERQKAILQNQNRKAYSDMQQSQNQQFVAFQQEWKQYLDDFQQQGVKKLKQTSLKKRQELYENQQSRISNYAPLISARYQGNPNHNTISSQSRVGSRRYSVLTSTKLTELQDKKRKLVLSGNYSQAIKLKQKIGQQKHHIQQNLFNKTQYIASKRSQSLKQKSDRIMENTFMNVQLGKHKMLNKKKQGENIMKIRMRSIRQQAKKKLDQRVRVELIRLKSLFYAAQQQHQGHRKHYY